MSGRQPFDPARLPFYYGWVVLVVGTVGVLASVPGQTAGVSVFTDDLIETTGLSRLQLANAYLIGTTASGLLLPRGGRAIDVVGSRVMAAGAVLGLAATLVGFSLVGPMSTLTGMAVMSLGFGCLRFSGQGLLTLSSRTMISQWFDRRRGLVSSFSNAFMSFAFSLTPAMLYALIEWTDFRWAWRYMAMGLIGVVGGLVVVFYRNTPESCGLTIDGADAAPEDGATNSLRDLTGATRREAVADRRFWIITLPVISMASVGTALTFHILDLGEEVGMNNDDIVRIFVPIALVSIPLTLLGGYLVDKLSPVLIAVAMAFLQIGMFLTVTELGHPAYRVVAIACWGAAQSGYAPLTSAALPKLFGRKHLGAIAGIQMSVTVIGSAIGPAFFALVHSIAGSYQRALWLSTALPVAAILLALTHLVRSTQERADPAV